MLLRGGENLPETSRKSIPCGQEERGIQGGEVVIKAWRNDNVHSEMNGAFRKVQGSLNEGCMWRPS